MENKNDGGQNNREYAAALRYEHGRDSAPLVVATGRGDLAAKIKEIAEQEKIPVYRDSILAQALVKLGAGTEIPPEMYEVIARILVHVARIDRKISPGL